MALTQDQINRRASAENTYKAALDSYNTKLATCNTSMAYTARKRQDALDCDAARAQYSIGWRKDQACGNRAQLYALWNEAQAAQDRCQAELLTINNLVASTKLALDAVVRQIDLEIVQAKDALQTDPQYILSKSRLDADIAEKEREQSAIKQERITKNVLIFLGVLVVVVGIVYLFRTNVIKLPS